MKQSGSNIKQQTSLNNKQQALTPHELVEQHMQHPDEPVTDAEMENLNIGIGNYAETEDEITLTPEEKKRADELADAIDSDGTDMSYKADI